jgi:hypothetical protein
VSYLEWFKLVAPAFLISIFIDVAIFSIRWWFIEVASRLTYRDAAVRFCSRHRSGSWQFATDLTRATARERHRAP